jgi:hypothetical protein
MYDIQHCFICRPSDSTVSADAGRLRHWLSDALTIRLDFIHHVLLRICAFKRQWRGMVFWSFDFVYGEDLRSKIFIDFDKNFVPPLPPSRDRLSLMYFSVLGEYGKILLAFSPYALKYILRILQISLNTFRVFEDDFVYHKYLTSL